MLLDHVGPQPDHAQLRQHWLSFSSFPRWHHAVACPLCHQPSILILRHWLLLIYSCWWHRAPSWDLLSLPHVLIPSCGFRTRLFPSEAQVDASGLHVFPGSRCADPNTCLHLLCMSTDAGFKLNSPPSWSSALPLPPKAVLSHHPPFSPQPCQPSCYSSQKRRCLCLFFPYTCPIPSSNPGGPNVKAQPELPHHTTPSGPVCSSVDHLSPGNGFLLPPPVPVV